ncbi:hypothetical protein IE53DRAFT_34526 [Violaceomyces palustris]|uniref:Uncharacterized protein n=1 Tax=Violaceomyces palustris TaxID=1673888 RepID=A0ACD0P1A8_9BASI|nr:hypothetical protein IE53DRAFT_34526 [Violaceomyces palustris]
MGRNQMPFTPSPDIPCFLHPLPVGILVVIILPLFSILFFFPLGASEHMVILIHPFFPISHCATLSSGSTLIQISPTWRMQCVHLCLHLHHPPSPLK